MLRGRGFRFHTLKGYKTAHNTLLEFAQTRPGRLTVADYDAAMHDEGHLRDVRGSAQNTVAGVVKQIKPFLAWVQENRGQTLTVNPGKLRVEWEDVDKVWLSADDLTKLEKVLLPSNLAVQSQSVMDYLSGEPCSKSDGTDTSRQRPHNAGNTTQYPT